MAQVLESSRGLPCFICVSNIKFIGLGRPRVYFWFMHITRVVATNKGEKIIEANTVHSSARKRVKRKWKQQSPHRERRGVWRGGGGGGGVVQGFESNLEPPEKRSLLRGTSDAERQASMQSHPFFFLPAIVFTHPDE